MQQPTRELSRRVLTKVDFENRFIGSKLRERSGPQMVTSYSFKEVVQLLQDRLPGVNLEHLQNWVRNVMGDDELADKILEISKAKATYVQQVGKIRNLMEKRLEQCRQTELLRVNHIIENVLARKT